MSLPQPPAESSPPPPTTDQPTPDLQALLDRPDDQRLREYKYRFAQTLVFGLPVLALQRFGPSLGGADAARWVGLLQALLAGWVVYVGAAGMLFEGIVRVSLAATPQRRRIGGDLIIASAAAGTYLWSVFRLIGVVVPPHAAAMPLLLFHWVVLLLACWTGWQCFRLEMRRRAVQSGSPSSD